MLAPAVYLNLDIGDMLGGKMLGGVLSLFNFL